MRVKLFFQNIKHHFVLSLYIYLICVFILTFFVVCVDSKNFLVKFNQQSIISNYNDSDIRISSTTPLSLRQLKHNSSIHNDYELINEYESVSAFYKASLIAKTNDKNVLIDVFEGKIDKLDSTKGLDKIINYKLAFSFPIELNQYEAVVSDSLSKKLDIGVGSTFYINIKEKQIEYKVVKVVENEGILSTDACLIGGNDLSKTYSKLDNFCNLILIKLKDKTHLDLVTSKLSQKEKYGLYDVLNLKDSSNFEYTFSKNTYLVYGLIIFACVMVLIIILRMYKIKTIKQYDYFESYNQLTYYKKQLLLSVVLLSLFVLLTSFISTPLLERVFTTRSQGSLDHKIKFIYYIYGYVFLVVLLLLFNFVDFKKKIKFKNIYLLFIIIGQIILSVIFLVFKFRALLSWIVCLSAFFWAFVLIIKLFDWFKKIPDYLTRLYLYTINKFNTLGKSLWYIYVILSFIICISLCSFVYFNSSIDKIASFSNIDTIAIPTDFKYELDNYDLVGVCDFIEIEDYRIDTVLSLNAKQVNELMSVKLSNNEQALFDSKNSIILPICFKYYEGYNVGDKITVKVPNQVTTQEYEIVKFFDLPIETMAILNETPSAIKGYLIDYEQINDELIEETKSSLYNYIDVKNTILVRSKQLESNLEVFKCILGISIVALVFILIYLALLDFDFQKKNIFKLKKLGASDRLINSLNYRKMLIQIIVVFIISFIVNSITSYFFDDFTSIIYTTIYIRYNILIVLISSLASVFCVFLGTVASIAITNKK